MEPKINDMTIQMLLQTKQKPNKFQASKAWNKVRLSAERSNEYDLLDNYFQNEK